MQLAARYGVSQPTVSKCVEHTEGVLGRFSPTAGNIHVRIEAARTVEKLQSALREAMSCLLRLAQAPSGPPASVPRTLPHNRLIRDGTHTPRCRPSDKGVRDTMWSGKKKMYSYNNVLTTNELGVVLEMSGCWPGSWHDMHVQRMEDDDGGGIMARCLFGRSEAMVIYEYGDRGLQGLQKLHPGAVVRTPPKRRKGKQLTKTQQDDAGRISRIRIAIEHTNARLKTFAFMRNKFRGSAEKMSRTADVLSGFVNYHLAMGMASPENTHRKQRKRGPKTWRNRRR